MAEKECLVLVDGSSLAFRMFYALFSQGLRSTGGTPTGAVFGFFMAILDLIERQKPEMLAVCFDREEPTFRHTDYEKYKANRSEMPDELSVQWPIIKEGVQLLGIPLYELPGYEADDVIGTVAKEAEKKDICVRILTGDKDAFQLVGDGPETTQVLMPATGRGGLVTYGRQEVKEKLGVYPEQVVDYKALCGDASDNIPGVRGIGPKTAVDLLTQFQTLEGIYENLESIKSQSVRKKLSEGKDSAVSSQKLARIVLDVPVSFDFDHCRVHASDLNRAIEFFQSLEMRALVNRIAKLAPALTSGAVQAGAVSTSETNRQGAGGAAESLTAAGSSPGAGEPLQLGLFDSQNATNSITLQKPRLSVAGLPTPLVVTSEDDLSRVLNEIASRKVVCVDLETTSLDALDTDIVGYAFAFSNDLTLDGQGRPLFSDESCSKPFDIKTAYIPVGHSPLIGQTQLDSRFVAERLKPVLESHAIGKIAQNAKFEMNVLSTLGIEFGPLVFDPMLASYIVNPDEKHGLKEQSQRIFGHEMVRITDIIGTGRKQANMSVVPVDKAAPYAADDARMTFLLACHYAPNLSEEQKRLLYEIEQPLSVVLAAMEQAGVALDLPYLSAFSKELTDEICRLEGEIFELAGHPFNINSTAQLQKVLFEELTLTPKGKTTKKTGLSTDAAVLEALKDEHAIIARLLEYRHLSKLRSTYVDGFPKLINRRDGRLHGTFNQTVAATGRLSSTNPNLQNIPIKTEIGRRIRRAFIPGEAGQVLMSADYSQIELRILAHLSGDETLIDAFSRNQDIHARTAMEIFDVKEDEMNAKMRGVGKTMNFALIYQQGDYRTGIDLGVSTSEARQFREKYFSRYPRVMRLVNETLEKARESGYVSTIWGRRRYFRYLNDRNANIRAADERAAFNAPLQGSAADLMKLAMIRLNGRLKEKNLKARLILQVHDEVVLEVPAEEVDTVKQTVIDSMLMDQPFKVPLVVDVGVGQNWMEAK